VVKQRRTWLTIVTTLGGLVACVLVPLYIFWYPGKPFDAVTWQQDAQLEQGDRIQMAKRLIARGTLEGMTRAEVVDLLGKPEDPAPLPRWDLMYWLPTGEYSPAEWLALRLSSSGRVKTCQIVADNGD
jgi:hypothetical protein